MSNSENDKPKFHYAIIPDALDDDERVPEHMKYTWAKLYRWCNNKKTWNPNVTGYWDALAQKTRLPKSTLQKHVKRFIEEGWASKKFNGYNKPITIILHKKRKEPKR